MSHDDNNKGLADYALDPVKRKEELGNSFRVHEKEEREDEFRTSYHRDRDRIIWSTASRRMQNKTQVFAHDDDDHFRRRLTHSIEVAGIACSIARQLELNEVATDAIALGHDIGHAPFGHAGEDALNEISKEFFPTGIRQPIPLKGFDHCAHAIEIVSRIETLNGTHPGLDLSFDIRDGILKHIYYTDNSSRTEEQLKDNPFSALSKIVECEEYKQYKCNCGSLEAQCVWFADKLTYLFDDLEDAIRAKIFKFDILKQRKLLASLNNISEKSINASNMEVNENMKNRIENEIRVAMRKLECDIVKAARKSQLDRILGEKFQDHYKKKGMRDLYGRSDMIQKNHPDDDVRQYLFWRNKAMTVMITDCVTATKQRIKDNSIDSVQKVLTCKKRLVDVSDDLKKAWRENKKDNFYKRAMHETLFEHRIVLRHTYNAGQKVRKLFDIYKSEEGYKLVPEDYKKATKKNYNSCDFGITDDNSDDVMKIITIRNYIAGFTDAYANQKLKEYLM